jgi:hypothetical protein
MLEIMVNAFYRNNTPKMVASLNSFWIRPIRGYLYQYHSHPSIIYYYAPDCVRVIALSVRRSLGFRPRWLRGQFVMDKRIKMPPDIPQFSLVNFVSTSAPYLTPRPQLYDSPARVSHPGLLNHGLHLSWQRKTLSYQIRVSPYQGNVTSSIRHDFNTSLPTGYNQYSQF